MSLVETIKYAKKKNWLDIPNNLENKGTFNTKLNNIVTKKQEDYTTKLNFKESLDKLDTTTKLNNTVLSIKNRYIIKQNFKKTLDTLETINEEEVILLHEPIDKEQTTLPLHHKSPDSIIESEINKSSNGWCSIS